MTATVANLRILTDQVELQYMVHEPINPVYVLRNRQNAVLPELFTTAKTPFVIPFDVQTFGGAIHVELDSGPPVFWSVKIEFFDQNKNAIKSTGFDPNGPVFDHITFTPQSTPLAPGVPSGAGMQPIFAIDDPQKNRNLSYQPHDMGVCQPVRWRRTVIATSELPKTDPPDPTIVVKTDPASTVLDIWLVRAHPCVT